MSRRTAPLSSPNMAALEEVVAAHAIGQLLARFANSFDLKDWGALHDCLAETIYTDYSALRGSPPQTMSRQRFVELRRAALGDLATHHLGGNLEVVVQGSAAEARLSMRILRRRADGEVLDTDCIYEFDLVRDTQGWSITGITQKVLWNSGNASIHAGVARASSAHASSGGQSVADTSLPGQAAKA